MRSALLVILVTVLAPLSAMAADGLDAMLFNICLATTGSVSMNGCIKPQREAYNAVVRYFDSIGRSSSKKKIYNQCNTAHGTQSKTNNFKVFNACLKSISRKEQKRFASRRVAADLARKELYGNRMLLCQNGIKRRIKFPSSVDASWLGATTIDHPEGFTVIMPFKAKNGFGNMLPMDGRCFFRNGKLSTVEIGNR